MTPEEIGMAYFGISLRDSDFAHLKTAQELTDKTMAAVMLGIQRAVQAEREACALVCDKRGQDIVGEWYGNEDYRRGANMCAAMIRARNVA